MVRALALDERRSALERAARICTERGATLTPARRRVLDWMFQAERPMGAYEILDQLTINSPPTIYRILHFLQQQGFIHRIESLNSYVSCRELGWGHPNQFVICNACGRTEETADPAIGRLLLKHGRNLGFRIERQIVELRGLCDTCRRASVQSTIATEELQP
jgi:Fur family zinc uptake transcriptional regulator